MFGSHWFSNLSFWSENNGYPAGPSQIELEPQTPDFYGSNAAYIANITDDGGVIAFWIDIEHHWEQPFFAVSHHTSTHITYSHLTPLTQLPATLATITGANTIPTPALSFLHQCITEETRRRDEHGEWSDHLFTYAPHDENTEHTLTKLLEAIHPLYRPGLTEWIIANHPTTAPHLFTPETLATNIHTALTHHPTPQPAN